MLVFFANIPLFRLLTNHVSPWCLILCYLIWVATINFTGPECAECCWSCITHWAWRNFRTYKNIQEELRCDMDREHTITLIHRTKYSINIRKFLRHLKSIQHFLFYIKFFYALFPCCHTQFYEHFLQLQKLLKEQCVHNESLMHLNNHPCPCCESFM